MTQIQYISTFNEKSYSGNKLVLLRWINILIINNSNKSGLMKLAIEKCVSFKVRTIHNDQYY
jgi:hypothetical protein